MLNPDFPCLEIFLYLVIIPFAIEYANTLCDEWAQFQPAAVTEPPAPLPHQTAVPEPVAEASVKPELNLSGIKLYKLHQQSVVPVSALPFQVPDSIRRYTLRHQPVVRVEALEAVASIIA